MHKWVMVQQLKLYDNCYNVEIFYNGPCSEPYEFSFTPNVSMNWHAKEKKSKICHSKNAPLLCKPPMFYHGSVVVVWHALIIIKSGF